MSATLADGGNKKAAVAGDEDRIGALPDDLLQLLLSFLPSRDSVRTCVLATRWRTLWKSVPSLRVDTSYWRSAHASNRTKDKDGCEICYSSSDESEESYDKADDMADCVILQGLAGAADLELITRIPMNFLKGLKDCYVFSKLKTLLLNEWCVADDFTGLVYFLQHSPNLEWLRLEPMCHEEFEYNSEICESYNQREHLGVSKHLKAVKILYLGNTGIIDQIWKILCAHGVSPELISTVW